MRAGRPILNSRPAYHLESHHARIRSFSHHVSRDPTAVWINLTNNSLPSTRGFFIIEADLRQFYSITGELRVASTHSKSAPNLPHGAPMVETTEREMVKKIDETSSKSLDQDRFTLLQPTYEDTIPPDPDNDWEHED